MYKLQKRAAIQDTALAKFHGINGNVSECDNKHGGMEVERDRGEREGACAVWGLS